ncbi:hypothetical protein V8C35DRAFT_276055 [Trichoderma chlorosporum]
MTDIDISSGDHPCIKAQKTLFAHQSLDAETIIRSACSECKRRKQKCTRFWPCLHCGNRRLPDECIFQTVLDVKSPEQRRTQLKHVAAQMKGLCCYSHELLDPLDDDSDGSDVDLEELGYSASHVASSYSGPRKKRKCAMPEPGKLSRSPHLEKAIRALPCSSCLDALVDNFLGFADFHCSIVHPATFRREYQNWPQRVSSGHQAETQWTALLLMACACSAQYPSDALRSTLEADQDQPMLQLSEKYFTAGHELAAVVSKGKYDMNTIQIYLHSSLWLKTKARYPECWSDLTNAIQVACELDTSREENNSQISNHHLEMVRRAWVTMYSWDWQLEADLSRSLSLQPDLYDTKPLGFLLGGGQASMAPSLDLIASMQYELISALLGAFGKSGSLKDIVKHRSIVESWAARLPPHLSLQNPDTSLDDDYSWLRFQRFNLTMLSTMSLLSPLRSYLAKPLSMSSPAEDLQFQRDGTLWALRHLNKIFQFLRIAFPKDSAYKTVLFFIFDVAALLCSAVMHDIDSSMPMREPALRAIEGSLGVMRILENHAPIAKQSYKILNHAYGELLRPSTAGDARRAKRRRLEPPQSQEFPNRRVEYMPELDAFWDNYDFSFVIYDQNDPLEWPVFTNDSLGSGTPF